MENLRGPIIWEVMDNGALELSEEDANDITGALLALCENQSLCDSLFSSRMPLTPLHPEGQVFGFDNDFHRVCSVSYYFPHGRLWGRKGLMK